MCIRDRGTYERLAHYISEVRESALLLQVKWSEQQLVDTIIVRPVSYTHLLCDFLIF